jgi:hypothetical protein
MHLDGETLTVDQLAEAAYLNTAVDVFPEQAARVKASRDLLVGFVESGRIIYGVTTAVGGFVNWLIPEELAEQLQNNILRGVSTNVGADLDDVYVRAAMAVSIRSAAACRPSVQRISKSTSLSITPVSFPVFLSRVRSALAAISGHSLILRWLLRAPGAPNTRAKSCRAMRH